MPYPSTSTDEEIYEKIATDSLELQRTEYDTHSIIRLTGQIQLGQNELQKRILVNAKIATESTLAVIEQMKDETTQLRIITKDASRTSTKMAWFSIGIGIASVFIALSAAWLTYQANQIASKANSSNLESSIK